jgi:hypothetical protein
VGMGGGKMMQRTRSRIDTTAVLRSRDRHVHRIQLWGVKKTNVAELGLGV